jgi:hypothetical protein
MVAVVVLEEVALLTFAYIFAKSAFRRRPVFAWSKNAEQRHKTIGQRACRSGSPAVV